MRADRRARRAEERRRADRLDAARRTPRACRSCTRSTCPAELREQIEEAMSRYPQLRSAAIPALWAVQRHYGWCSPEGLREAAAVMGVTPAYLESVASFYDLFATSPIGRHRVLVCHNISCWMRGADELLERVLRGDRRRPPRRRPRTGRARPTASSSSRASSASAPATSRRWSRSTSATTGRSSGDDAVGRDRGRARRRRAAAGQGDLAPPGRRRARAAARPAPGGGRTLPETRVLFRHIDDPDAGDDRRLHGAAAATGRSSGRSASSTRRS